MIRDVGPRAGAARILPYPDGKLFAFTIVDDTDGETLEVARAVYSELIALGLKTTKTVWVMPPPAAPATPWDEGDTLQSAEYVDYMRELQSHGFEMALHNVSSRSNTRKSIADGIERFRDVFGMYPKMNVHHEKNRENIYFDVANSPARLPGSFRSAAFRRCRSVERRVMRQRPAPPPSFSCEGEKIGSEYFWGDICRERIKYVRSNVFVRGLNTIKQCPDMPVSYADTPYVNYWFYCSGGQDAAQFNRILSRRNVSLLQKENGAAILYTHFAKGFVRVEGSRLVLNPETRERLRFIAAQENGWFAPAGEILDRLLVFQNVFAASLAGGFAVYNGNGFPVSGLTLLARRNSAFFSPRGERFTSDRLGRLIVGDIGPRETLLFFRRDPTSGMSHWLTDPRPAFLADIVEVCSRVRGALWKAWRDRPQRDLPRVEERWWNG